MLELSPTGSGWLGSRTHFWTSLRPGLTCSPQRVDSEPHPSRIEDHRWELPKDEGNGYWENQSRCLACGQRWHPPVSVLEKHTGSDAKSSDLLDVYWVPGAICILCLTLIISLWGVYCCYAHIAIVSSGAEIESRLDNFKPFYTWPLYYMLVYPVCTTTTFIVFSLYFHILCLKVMD